MGMLKLSGEASMSVSDIYTCRRSKTSGDLRHPQMSRRPIFHAEMAGNLNTMSQSGISAKVLRRRGMST